MISLAFGALLFVGAARAAVEDLGACFSEATLEREEQFSTAIYSLENRPHVCFGFDLERAGAADDLSTLLGVALDDVLSARVELTRAQCVTLLDNDMRVAKACVAQFVPDVDQLSTDQQSALADMAYHLGCEQLSTFAAVQAAIAAGDLALAAREVAATRFCDDVGCRCARVQVCLDTCSEALGNSCEAPVGVGACVPGQNNNNDNGNNNGNNGDDCAPVDCAYGDYGAWSKCSRSCGGGKQFRTRAVETAAACGGAACSGERNDVRPCNLQLCAAGGDPYGDDDDESEARSRDDTEQNAEDENNAFAVGGLDSTTLGIVLAATAVGLIGLFLIVFFVRRRRRNEKGFGDSYQPSNANGAVANPLFTQQEHGGDNPLFSENSYPSELFAPGAYSEPSDVRASLSAAPQADAFSADGSVASRHYTGLPVDASNGAIGQLNANEQFAVDNPYATVDEFPSERTA